MEDLIQRPTLCKFIVCGQSKCLWVLSASVAWWKFHPSPFPRRLRLRNWVGRCSSETFQSERSTKKPEKDSVFLRQNTQCFFTHSAFTLGGLKNISKICMEWFSTTYRSTATSCALFFSFPLTTYCCYFCLRLQLFDW